MKLPRVLEARINDEHGERIEKRHAPEAFVARIGVSNRGDG